MSICLTLPLPDVGLYCLTVEGTRRCELQHRQADENKLPVLFVYGRKFDFDLIKQDGGNLSDQRWHCLSMFGNNPGYIFRAYSCAAGHRDILRLFINSNHTHALVFEDDMLYLPNIVQIVYKIIRRYPNQHYFDLNVEARSKLIRKPYVADLNKLEVVFRPSGSGTGMYVVDRYFALYALNNMLKTLHLPSDVVTWREWSPILKIAVVYGTGVALSDENINSLIGYGTQQ